MIKTIMNHNKWETKGSGYIYILTNPSFCEDWVKIVLYQKSWFHVRLFKDFDYLCNGFRKKCGFQNYWLWISVRHLICLRNVENINRQVAQARQKKDEVSARVIVWASLIMYWRSFPRSRRGWCKFTLLSFRNETVQNNNIEVVPDTDFLFYLQ